jgi:hypothetical protein
MSGAATRKRGRRGAEGGAGAGVKRARADVDEVERRLRAAAEEHVRAFGVGKEEARALRRCLDDLGASMVSALRAHTEDVWDEARTAALEPVDAALTGRVDQLRRQADLLAGQVLDARERVPAAVAARIRARGGAAVRALSGDIAPPPAAAVADALRALPAPQGLRDALPDASKAGGLPDAAAAFRAAAKDLRAAAQPLLPAAQAAQRTLDAKDAATRRHAPAEFEKVLAGKADPAAPTPAKARK